MNITAARDAMQHRCIESNHRLSGAYEVMNALPCPWPDEIEGAWRRMSRRCDRQWAAWQRLAAAANRTGAAV